MTRVGKGPVSFRDVEEAFIGTASTVSYHSKGWDKMALMAEEKGSIAIRHGDKIYCLLFVSQGWMAADVVRYLDDVLASETPEVEILKLLGYTMQIQTEFPRRKAAHWVEVDLENKELRTNSDLIRQAVHKVKPEEGLYSETSLRSLYEVLDRHDFTVKLF